MYGTVRPKPKPSHNQSRQTDRQLLAPTSIEHRAMKFGTKFIRNLVSNVAKKYGHLPILKTKNGPILKKRQPYNDKI